MRAVNRSSLTGKAAQQVEKVQQQRVQQGRDAVMDVAGSVEDLMTPDEVAALLRVTRKAVYARSDRGQFPKVKIGGSVRFRRGDLLAFIAAGRAPSPRSSR